ncbi:MAG TPA: hypothetical protein VNA24_03405 [Hyalangium sp.]|jgi:hypothetical protein|nr:hypothetical protein [Hyalangium sp.]
MTFAKRALLVSGLLTGTLTFVGCGPHTPAVRESPYGDNTNAGFGHVSKTKQSDDNLRMPLEDPLRTKESESIVAAENEPDLKEGAQAATGVGGSGTPQNCPTPEQGL